MNDSTLILPNSELFKSDDRYGCSFKLINDNIHYLQINRSIFDKINHDYSFELWFKINYYSIVIKTNDKEFLVNPILFHIYESSNEKIKIQCDSHFILLNNRRIIRYEPNQWHQIVLTHGENGIINSNLSKIFVNGKLITKENHLLPILQKKNIPDNGIIIGGSSPSDQLNCSINNRYILLNQYDNQQSEWSILKLYNKSLEFAEINRNFLAHANRFGLSMELNYPHITNNLIVYFDVNNVNCYVHPSNILKNIAQLDQSILGTVTRSISPSNNLKSNIKTDPSSNINQSQLENISKPQSNITHWLCNSVSIGKNKSVKNIYYPTDNSNMSQEEDVQILSKLIARFLSQNNFAKQSIESDLIEQQREYKKNLNIPKSTNIFFDDIFENQNFNDLKINPIKIRNILQYFQKNPRHLIELIQKDNINQFEKKNLFNLIEENQLIRGENSGDIISNPFKLELLKHFISNNPKIFIELLANDNLKPNDLIELYLSSISKNNAPNSIIDTFEGHSSSSNSSEQKNPYDPIDYLNELVDKLAENIKFPVKKNDNRKLETIDQTSNYNKKIFDELQELRKQININKSIQNQTQRHNNQYSNNQQPMNQQQYINQQPINQQPINQQLINQQPINQQPINQQFNQQPFNQQPFNQQAINQQAINQQPFNQQPINQPPINQSFNQQPINQPLINQQPINQQTINPQMLNQQPINQQLMNQLSMNQQLIHQQLIDQSLNPELTDQYYNNEYLNNQYSNNKPFNNQSSNQSPNNQSPNNQLMTGQYITNQSSNNQSRNNQFGNNQYANNQSANNQYSNNQFVNSNNKSTNNNEYRNNPNLYKNDQYSNNLIPNNQYNNNLVEINSNLKNKLLAQKKIDSDKKMEKLQKLNNIESQLQKLMQSNMISDKKNQLQLFQLVKLFQDIKNDILLKLSESDSLNTIGDDSEIIKNRLTMLDKKLKNMEKMCLHAPNVSGYVSDGNNRVGLIDQIGQIDYIGKYEQPLNPYYISFKNGQNKVPQMMLPTAVEYINQPENKDHELIGQVVDSTQKLSMGLIMKNNNKQYLILIHPVPKLSDIPIMAITASRQQQLSQLSSQQPNHLSKVINQKSNSGQTANLNQTTNLNRKANPNEKPNQQKCLTGMQSSVYQGSMDWTQINSKNEKSESSKKISNNNQKIGSQLKVSDLNNQSNNSNIMNSGTPVNQNIKSQTEINQKNNNMNRERTPINQNIKSQPQINQNNNVPQNLDILSTSQFDFLDQL